MMIPTTADRVQDHTADHVNEAIRDQARLSVRRAAAGGRDAIERRLEELDREWDVERTLEANAATLAFSGVVLAATVDRRGLLLPGVVTAFLLQHAVEGWCPPLPVFRRLGFRTADEIAEERYALKALRGDFHGVGSDSDPDRALTAVQH